MNELTEFELGHSQLDAENSFLGIILVKPHLLKNARVTAKHFVASSNILFMEQINEMERDNKTIDHASVSHELLKKTGREFLGIAYGLSSDTFNYGFFKSYENIILYNYRKRMILEISKNLSKNLNPDEAIQSLMGIDTEERNYSFTMKEAVFTAIENAQKSAAVDGLTGLSTGLTELDDIFGGLQKSDLYILGARPAMGKTATALNFLINNDVPTLIFSTEQPYDQIGLRAISIKSGVSAAKIRKAEFEGNDIAHMNAGALQLAENKSHIYDKGVLTITELMREARRFKYTYGIKAIYVDYIQRIKGSKVQDKRLEVAEVVTSLKSLAKELNIPVVALAQVSRKVDERNDHRPTMADLLESGAIEQEADVIMFLYRDEIYNKKTSDKGIIEILIRKNRHGGIGDVRCAWLAKTMQVKNLSHSDYCRPETFA